MHIDITTFDIWLLHPELWFTAVFENGPNQKKNKKKSLAVDVYGILSVYKS